MNCGLECNEVLFACYNKLRELPLIEQLSYIMKIKHKLLHHENKTQII